MNKNIIAIDLNGGDHAPFSVIRGLELALKRGYVSAKEVVCLGTAEAIAKIAPLVKKEASLKAVRFQESKCEVLMGDDLKQIIRRRESTMSDGLHGIKNGEFSAFVSAGNTKALVILSIKILRCLKPDLRPALISPIPNICGTCLLTDIGAMLEARSVDLVNCAVMGKLYAEQMYGISQPLIKLHNVGQEKTKGNDTLILAGELLTEESASGNVNFGGNIEGNSLFTTPVNVVICPGEIGNAIVKVTEGFELYISRLFDRFKVGWAWRLIKYFYLRHKDVGGAILLGVNGIVIKAHGNSSPLAIANAIRRAKKELEVGIISHIKEAFADESDEEDAEEVKINEP